MPVRWLLVALALHAAGVGWMVWGTDVAPQALQPARQPESLRQERLIAQVDLRTVRPSPRDQTTQSTQAPPPQRTSEHPASGMQPARPPAAAALNIGTPRETERSSLGGGPVTTSLPSSAMNAADAVAAIAVTPGPGVQQATDPGLRTQELPSPNTGQGAISRRSPAIGAAAQDDASRTAEPRVDASWQGNLPPPYPMAARRQGVQGRVKLDLLIEADGSVSQVRMRESSGSPLLDRSVMTTVRQWRFIPARHQGQSIAAWYSDWEWVFRLQEGS